MSEGTFLRPRAEPLGTAGRGGGRAGGGGGVHAEGGGLATRNPKSRGTRKRGPREAGG
jgi:hypothetical protein